MPAPEPATRPRRRLALFAPLIPLALLLAAMGATEALARDPSSPVQHFKAASDEVNRAQGLVRSEACGGLLTSALANTEEGSAAGCTHGLDLYEAGATQTVAASGDLPPIPDPPGIPCYTSGPYVKVLYIYDRNGTSKLNQRKPLIREIVAQADKVVNDSAAEHDVKRHVRWLMSSTCKLKVVAVGADLSLDVISLRVNLMSRGLLASSQKGLAFTESFGYGGCSGIAEARQDDRAGSNNTNNSGGMLALVYAGCWTAGESVLMGTEVATHEMLHTLGAVQPSAPNSTPMFHCTDESDVMCYEDGTGLPMRNICPVNEPELLDCERNDYFNPNPPSGSYLATHWNTARSAYLSSASPNQWDRLARPTVSLSGPTGTVSGTVTYTATAAAPSGASISHVAFEVNGTHVGSDYSAPYRLNLGTLPEEGGWGNGQKIKVTAYAVDNYFRWKASNTKQATVGNPKVRLITPTEYDIASGDMPWSATAVAGTGRTIAKVELLVNGSVKATATTAPWGGTFNARPYLGGMQVSVRVTDSAGATRTGPARWIDVQAPYVELTRPMAWDVTYADTSVLLAANASAPPGVGIKRVEFLVNATKVGTDTSAPYTYLYDASGQADGALLNVTARVVDARGHQYTSAVGQVQVEHDAHEATITAPAAGATVIGQVALTADVSPDAGWDVWSVAFLVDGQAVEWDYEAPWEASWDSLGYGYANGGHVVSVRVDASDGINSATFESSGTAVTLANPQSSLAITAPAAGSTIKGNVTVSASVSLAPGDSIWGVDFYAGSQWIGSDDSAPYRITWDTSYNHDGPVPLRAVMQSSLTWTEISSAIRTVNLANLWARPTKPAAGASVSGNVTLAAKANVDIEGDVEAVKFLIDNKVVKTDWSSPFSVSWNSASVPNGTHTLRVRVITTDGRSKTSSARSFTVAN